MARVLLVRFDAGTQLTCPIQEREKRLLPRGGLSAFPHRYRYRSPKYQSEKSEKPSSSPLHNYAHGNLQNQSPPPKVIHMF